MKQVGLLLFPEFSEFEVTVATSLLRGFYELMTVALTAEPVTSEAGLTFLPGKTLENVNPAELDAFLIPGGNMSHLKDAEPLFAFVKELHKQEKLLAAICSGPYVLAQAGVLENRPYTVTYNKEARDFLGGFDEATFRYEHVVSAGNIITAQGHAFVAFGLAVAKYLDPELSADVYSFYEGRANTLMD